MSPRIILLAVCFCLGLTLLYCTTHIIFDTFYQSVKTVKLSKKEGDDTKIVILDYTGYIENYSEYAVGNCLITNNRTFVDQANAVVVTTRKLKTISALPKFRQSWQRWVWLIDESPHHSVDAQPFTLTDFKNVYNWTMTYRTNSDVYIPYGRTQPKSKPEKILPDLGNRGRLVAAVISNCQAKYIHNYRMEYIKMLMTTVQITIYGRCGQVCPGYDQKMMHSICPELSKYLFYLAFENANCKEYITEKLFANGFEAGTVPIVLGASKEDYKKIAPPNSFIHVSDYKNAQQLGEYLNYLANNRTAYMQYHMWRKEYTTSYRLQFISRSVWENLCEKLNDDNGSPKIIPDLNSVWTTSDCDNTLYWG